MSARIVFFVDAPQHYRIVETMLGTLVEPCNVHVLATASSVPRFNVPQSVHLHVHLIVAQAWEGGARFVQILHVGRKRLRLVRDVMATQVLGAVENLSVVVFNDTGIVQRDLLRMGLTEGWHTILVQDGLTETTYRENRWGFRLKRAITLLILAPLGLGHYGTTRYGQSGARTILADGPVAARFFRVRAPKARVLDVGFLRPAARESGAGPHTHILFWAVDFLGGLQDESLHRAQLDMIQTLAHNLARAGASRMRLAVRLHPRDVVFKAKYMEALSRHGNLDLIDPVEIPDPFGDGVPLMSMSLQSAGVFDALAAGIPSFFIGWEGRNIGPAWVPAALWLPGPEAFMAELRALLMEEPLRDRLWAEQAASLASTMKIPFDAQAVQRALQSALPE